MKMNPLDEYEQPEYPPLQSVEKRIRSAALSGKKAATLGMAIATALSLSMCGTRTETKDSSHLTEVQFSNDNSSEESTGLNMTQAETSQVWTSTAGIVIAEETVSTESGLELAGDIMAPVETTPAAVD